MSLRGLQENLHESHEILDVHHRHREHRAERNIQEMEFERCEISRMTVPPLMY